MERRSVSAIAALGDDLRRGLYAFIRRAGRPVTREEAADNAGISRKLAAFHLDKLVHVGLLDSDVTHAVPGRAGRPGRTPKVYEPAETEIRVSIPERRYELVGDILVDAVTDVGDQAHDAALRAARAHGVGLGEAISAEHAAQSGARHPPTVAWAVLESLGYEPATNANVVTLRNCPFHHLAEKQRELVCGINRAFLDGLLGGLGDETTTTVLAPGDKRCCVELHPRTC